MADWARIPASAIGTIRSTNRSLLNILETDDKYLQSIHDRFLFMLREQQRAGRDLEVTCFFEELPLPRFGIVVSKDSATLEGYTAISIHANHRNMVKFGSTDDNGFKRLLGELIRWESKISNSAAMQPTGGAQTEESLGCSPESPRLRRQFHTLQSSRKGNDPQSLILLLPRYPQLIMSPRHRSTRACDTGLFEIFGIPRNGHSVQRH